MNIRFIALLRGINAGTLHRVEMGKLKQLFERLGYTRVSTYLNSGNILFEAEQEAEEIRKNVEASLKEELGFEIPTLVKSDIEMLRIVSAIPVSWQNNSEQRTDVAFLFPQIDLEKVLSDLPVKRDFIDLCYLPGAVIWNLDRKNLNKSQLNKIISHPHYKLMTVRNVNTARFLAGKNRDPDNIE
jgi:uncharacterized protein (DUF1697 family)